MPIGDAIGDWILDSKSSAGTGMKIAVLVLGACAIAMLVVLFLAITTTQEPGECVSWHLEHSKGYHAVCDVWLVTE